MESIRQQSRQVLVLGVDARENPGGHLRADPNFSFCQAPFFMTFLTGSIPHAGSWQMVVGESTQLAGGVHLYLWWREHFLGVMSEIISSCGGGTLSSFARWAPLSLWPLELWHRPPLKFRRGLEAPLSLQGGSSGVLCGVGISSTCCLGVLTSFHRVALLYL